MKKKNYVLTVAAIFTLTFTSCKKHHYKACFTGDKSTAAIGATITFSNCSDFDGGYTDCHWTFGDGTDTYTKGQVSVQHSYSVTGQYEVQLGVGEKENNSEQKITITIQ